MAVVFSRSESEALTGFVNKLFDIGLKDDAIKVGELILEVEERWREYPLEKQGEPTPT